MSLFVLKIVLMIVVMDVRVFREVIVIFKVFDYVSFILKVVLSYLCDRIQVRD